jgi:hypothetical protein
LLELFDTLASDDFAQCARRPNAPGAFSRSRRLPLPALGASLLFMRASSQQAMFDSFFGNLCGGHHQQDASPNHTRTLCAPPDGSKPHPRFA